MGPGIGAGRMIGRSAKAIPSDARDRSGLPSTGTRDVGHAAQAGGATLRWTPQGGAPLADKGPERSRSRAGHPHVETRPDPRSAEASTRRSEEHTSELQSPCNLVCRLLLEK